MLKWFPLLLVFSLFGQTLRLFNDSAFDLHCTIYAWDGSRLETLDIGPRERERRLASLLKELKE